MAGSPDRELGEARNAIDRGDARAALKSLDRARKGYARALDPEGLEHVLDMAALLDASDERVRIGRENLAYAAKQNLRQESRRRARQLSRDWTDPFPDLQAPTEHTGIVLTRGLKLWIGLGVLVGVVAIAGIILALALVDTGPETTVTLRLVNDTGRTVRVRACGADPSCSGDFSSRKLQPGEGLEATVDANRLVQVYRLEHAGPDDCLPVRIHDAYQRGGQTFAASLSQATPCPGTTVLPRPVESDSAPL
jgi:hypothetical protein